LNLQPSTLNDYGGRYSK